MEKVIRERTSTWMKDKRKGKEERGVSVEKEGIEGRRRENRNMIR